MSQRDNIYEQEIQQHIVKMVNILDFYEKKEHFSDIDILAIERALQVLIESLIGFCRYVADMWFQIKVSKSREAVEAMKKMEIITSHEYRTVQNMIGCRNILVHDYLNIDDNIIMAIVQKKEYASVVDIFKKILSYVQNS